MNIIFSQMKAIADRLTQSQGVLKRTLIVGLVTLGLWTASVSTPAYAADANDYYSNERGSLQNTERYDQIQPDSGGMNGFDDTDPRRNTQAAEAKAKALSDRAERMLDESADPLENAREAISNIKSGLGESVDSAADSISNQADKVSGKVGQAADRLGRKVDGVTDRVGNRTERAADRMVRTTDNMNGRVPNQTN